MRGSRGETVEGAPLARLAPIGSMSEDAEPPLALLFPRPVARRMHPSVLDETILEALSACAAFLEAGEWRGRENELVNLFALGFLMPRICPPGGNLDPTQIGIEVAVPQVAEPGKRRTADVRKDLVLWRAPRTTNWTPSVPSESRVLAVMEWKSLNNTGIAERTPAKHRTHESDIRWLQAATSLDTAMNGYAVLADLRAKSFVVRCTIVRAGQVVLPEHEFRRRTG